MAVLEYMTGTLESARRQADRVVSPDTRTKALQGIHDFALEHPLLFSFIVVQALFALGPVLFFASFVLGVLCLALVAALLFSLFWISLAALVLGSILFVTSAVAVLAWVWAVAAYVAASFAYGLVISKRSSTTASCPTDGPKLQGKWECVVKKEPDTSSEAANSGENHKDRSVENEADGNGIKGGGLNGNGSHDARPVDETPPLTLDSDASIL